MALLQIPHQVEDLGLDGNVERRNRLVGDDEFRVERERSGEADTLPLTARELVRIQLGRAGGETDLAEELDDTFVLRTTVTDPLDDERLPDDRLDAHARVERGVRVLEDHLQVTPSAAAARVPAAR